MMNDRIFSRSRDSTNVSTIDRLALGRAQHFQSRENRPKSISDDETDAVSDWSDSDQECCPLSDFESNEDPQEKILLPEIFRSNLSRVIEIPLVVIDDSTTSTQLSLTNDNDKPKGDLQKKPSVNSIQSCRQSQAPLLPSRRLQTKEVQPARSIINLQPSYTPRYRKAVLPNPTRLHQRRETTCTSISSNTQLSKGSTCSSFHSYDDNQNQRQVLSPSLSQTSVPRVYEMKKIFVDDYDYGRLTDLSPTRAARASSRQKWGTIVHPPFPLGYQHIPPEQVTQAVERLSSPGRCRDRHTPMQTPSKRYLSVEETNALINRLTKTKPIHSSDQYWPVQRQSRPVKTLNNNWKAVGISA